MNAAEVRTWFVIGVATIMAALAGRRPVQASGVVGSGTAASCTDAALNTALTDGGPVTFNCGAAAVTIDISPTGTKTIDTDTTINGGSLITLSGGNAVSVFMVNAGVKFTVQNLTIANGNGSSGGIDGGGISSNGMLTVTNTTFSINSAFNAGAIYSSGTLTVTHSAFSGNSARTAGAIQNDSGTMSVADSTFSDNSTSNGSGGAIFSVGPVATITNSSFSGNNASSGTGGGAIFNGATLAVISSTFSNNTTTDEGGAIYNSGTLSVSSSNFSANIADSDGGVIDNDGGNVTVTDCTLSDNNASGNGGAIDNDSGTAAVTNSILSGNIAASGNGGAIDNDRGAVTVTNDTFADNTANGDGGAISSSGPSVTVTNSAFSGNSAGQGGGGICNSDGTLAVTNSTFSDDSAGGGGGAIDNFQGTVFVTNNTFAANTTNDSGGAIANFQGTVFATNSTFAGNGASNGGGAIENNSGTVTVTNTILATSPAGGNCDGSIVDHGHNLDDGTTCGFKGTGCTTTNGSSLCNTDPLLDPAGLGNHGGPTQTIALCTGPGTPAASCTAASPTINAGDEAVCMTTTGRAPVDNLDQRGFVRPGAGHMNCAIGAYEADASGAFTPTPTASSTNTVATTPTFTASSMVTPTRTPTSTPTATTTVTTTPTPSVTNTAATPTPTQTATATPIPLPVNGTCMRPGSQGLVPCDAGTMVTIFLCNDRSCAKGALITLTVTQTDATGHFAVVVDRRLVAGKRLIVDAVIVQTASLHATTLPAASETDVDYRIMDFGPAAAEPNLDVAIDPISEAAIGLVYETGPENYTDMGIRDVIQAVRTADTGIDFTGATPSAAVNLATETARSDPGVQGALLNLCTSGDCNGSGSVSPDELLAVVTIALGNAEPSACPNGIPSGVGVNVTWLLQAVNNAVSGCGG